ncbi:iron chelate uptake ABC transporter family permease subunit [Heyndrickxia acidiproducens]|uniref:iron chelate uptake ABC transporter family permease subunit n=1 Tax=Heyndrickxia acidiproducens TaxID=1121084 RepID=UPI00035CEB10|nr:iron chelate uptake ABC transporter family permease subunit [Heyndrickxia acidiproducens]
MRNRIKLLALLLAAALLIAGYIWIGSYNDWNYIIPSRSRKIFAIILTGSAIAFSSLIFQTITQNRILTPSVLGLDSLYMLIQTVVVFLFGAKTLTIVQSNLNFAVSLGVMILFSAVLFHLILRKGKQNLYFLLLIGMIFGTLFGSFSSFMQMLIDPNEFLILQDKMFASFNNVNVNLLWASFALTVAAGLYYMRFARYMDVMLLGRDQAMNLGVDYDRIVKHLLLIVVILISTATALVGPVTFLGLLVVNVAYQFFDTYRHKILIPGAMLISIIALTGGQLLSERVFEFSAPLSVIINFVGGIYFIYLLLKESRAW